MSIESALARGQALAERNMVDSCTIRRRDFGNDVTNPDTGQVTKAYVSPNPYAGKCRVQQALAQAQQQDAGEDYTLLLRLEVQLPVVASVGLEVGDEVTITASVNDPDLVGRTFLIRDLFHKTHPTSRRIQVTERTD